MVLLEALEVEDDQALLRSLIEKHVRHTGSERGQYVLNNFERLLPKFVKVIPTEYKKVLEERFLAKQALGETQLEVAANG